MIFVCYYCAEGNVSIKKPGAIEQEVYGVVLDAAEVDFRFKLILNVVYKFYMLTSFFKLRGLSFSLRQNITAKV